MEARNAVEELSGNGYSRIARSLRSSEEAFKLAEEVIEICGFKGGLPPLAVIGDFVVPPLESRESRSFQTLHLDFGLPLDPKIAREVAFYTALYVPIDTISTSAETRLVPLVELLSQRTWPPLEVLAENFRNYGLTHGAWNDDQGYTEGILARIVEAADGVRSPDLPSVKVEPDFLCGLEFNSIVEEVRFLQSHGLRVNEVEVRVKLQPGDLLIFNNLAMSHGRHGTRQPGELRQRVFGQVLQPEEQRQLRDRVFAELPIRRTSPSVPS